MIFWPEPGPKPNRAPSARGDPLAVLCNATFWKLFSRLPAEVQGLALEKYGLFKQNPFHPSLGFQQKGGVWTAEIGCSYRAIGLRSGEQVTWFWIGSHEDYNRVLHRVR